MSDQAPPAPDPIAQEIERRAAAAADLVKYLPRIESALKSGDLDAASLLVVSFTEAVLKATRKTPPREPEGGLRRAGSVVESRVAKMLREGSY